MWNWIQTLLSYSAFLIVANCDFLLFFRGRDKTDEKAPQGYLDIKWLLQKSILKIWV